MRLVLGAAQLGMNYGLYKNKRISKNELKKVEREVLKSNIMFIDTASEYGKSEEVIGNSKLKNLRIITKMLFHTKKKNIENLFNQQI